MPSGNQDWFVRNADSRNPNAAIRRDPAYFADECAAAIVNETLMRPGDVPNTLRTMLTATVDDDGLSDAEFRQSVRRSLANLDIASGTTS